VTGVQTCALPIYPEVAGHAVLRGHVGVELVRHRREQAGGGEGADGPGVLGPEAVGRAGGAHLGDQHGELGGAAVADDDVDPGLGLEDRKSTRLNSSHVKISYAVFCLEIKTNELWQQL